MTHLSVTFNDEPNHSNIIDKYIFALPQKSRKKIISYITDVTSTKKREATGSVHISDYTVSQPISQSATRNTRHISFLYLTNLKSRDYSSGSFEKWDREVQSYSSSYCMYGPSILFQGALTKPE
jgi:hypothetical protein